MTSGCTNFKTNFDCPVSKGMGCKRLSTINEEYNIQHGIENVTSGTTYTKSDRVDVYLDGYEDESGVYHHPRKITIKT